ncbi:CPBP family intramembrane glutamic endopeptidase [Mycobacterium sp. NPDC006124]|uniref:Rv0804 family intramembrane glutamic endopeptidase n=1 Tax=Mycobacterium sp. NPDC006124 TaxID=3156729 RepID=UPI0033A25DA8
MPERALRALCVAGGVLAWKVVVAPRVPSRWQVPARAVLGTGLVAGTRAPLGLRPPELRAGLTTGSGVAATIFAVVGASTALRSVRSSLAGRDVPADVGAWLIRDIPIGTAWFEEAAYRAALGTAAARAFGPRRGRLLQATVFGLSHVPDARAAGDSVLGTVLITATAGWLFGWLHSRTGSLAAPMLAHLATNEAGAVSTVLVQRTRRATSTPTVTG